MAKAADDFDHRHRAYTARAERVVKSRRRDNTRESRDRFMTSLWELRWNRFFVPDVVESYVRVAPRQVEEPTKAPWRLEDSVWASRKNTADAKGFYDTEATYQRMFRCDWGKANKKRLARFIVTHDDDGMADVDEDGILDEIADVERALWENHRLVYMIFDFYATLGASNDIFHIHLNAYNQLIENCGLAVDKSPYCQKKHMDQIFVLVNAGNEVNDERFNKSRALNRHEFMQILVRIATARYVMNGRIPDVSEALHELFNADFDQKLDPVVMQDSNAFRKEYCYTEAVDAVLKRHAPSLKALYSRYADARVVEQDTTLSKATLMSFEEWMKLCKDLNFIDDHFTLRHVSLCFVWSRMRVVDENDPRSRIRMIHLSFVDFLEAIVRLATMKGMPTDEEIEAANCLDAGHFIHFQQSIPGTAYKQWLDSHAQHWNEVPAQPIERCVEHLISLILRTVEGSVSKKHDSKLSESEATKFMRHGTRSSNEIVQSLEKQKKPAASRSGGSQVRSRSPKTT